VNIIIIIIMRLCAGGLKKIKKIKIIIIIIIIITGRN